MLLATRDELEARRGVARGALAPLVTALRAELEPLAASEVVDAPHAKALLSRDGGRCARDGTQLEFDPFAPSAHRCPACGAVHEGERHDRWWAMGAHLWLAERAVHAALLFALCGEERLRELASTILGAYTTRYLGYPNRDNVLGPSRPFFSTYLESIWLLQLCVALDLLELAGEGGSLAGRVRERIVEPSSSLIASYPEGLSNRQVWNSAALLASARLLGRPELAEQLVLGDGGLTTLLSRALLPDGTWYEGENYHQFAHRGLWYGVMMAARAGLSLDESLSCRFDEGFATPLATALPDLTLPARRDARYGASLRQWRWAESFELGLARRDDARLTGALHALYRWNGPRGDTGRARSTAEADRDAPPSALSRADLGWRSLLCARPTLPPDPGMTATSVLLGAQGIGVLRRSSGNVYAALDYGHSGGGHGHPDRLNVLLAVGATRVLDDPGTGSYVDPALHWYRSTLAHNAPLLNGRSQPRVDGQLLAFEEQDEAGWICAELSLGALAPGVRATRALVALAGYLVDRFEWTSSGPVQMDLPFHLAQRPASGSAPGLGVPATPHLGDSCGEEGKWRPAPLEGGAGVEDGFAWASESETREATTAGALRVVVPATGSPPGESTPTALAWILTHGQTTWWRAVAPGPPGTGPRPFLLLRQCGVAGSVVTVWCWSGHTVDAGLDGEAIEVLLRNGRRHLHRPGERAWRIAMHGGGRRTCLELGGTRAGGASAASSRADATGSYRGGERSSARVRRSPPVPASSIHTTRAHSAAFVRLVADVPWCTILGAAHYRRSEASWEEAGAPTAHISIVALEGALRVEAAVRTPDVIFRPANAPDPALDNENPDIHSSGVQLHLYVDAWAEPAGWLAVPELDSGGQVRLHASGAAASIRAAASWEPRTDGYVVTFELPLGAFGAGPTHAFALALVVNDMGAQRERRRGQLALGAVPGEFIYLRGDREPREAYVDFVIEPSGVEVP